MATKVKIVRELIDGSFVDTFEVSINNALTHLGGSLTDIKVTETLDKYGDVHCTAVIIYEVSDGEN